jgi:hypothetical protein
MPEQPKPEAPKTNFGALVNGPRGMKNVPATKNPDALAAWVNLKRAASKRG